MEFVTSDKGGDVTLTLLLYTAVKSHKIVITVNLINGITVLRLDGLCYHSEASGIVTSTLLLYTAAGSQKFLPP